uniref:Uncharacterized protein n=1 Tax=Cyprinus carpio TaxID=7962 RepID=A0A8C2HMI3_CYPCA
MFDGLNNNRAHWKELADIYQAKVDAIENERKRLEEDSHKKINIVINYSPSCCSK